MMVKSLLSALLLGAMPLSLAAQDTDPMTVAEPPFFERQDGVAMTAIALSFAGLIANASVAPEAATRVRGGFGLVGGLAGVAGGVYLVGRESQGMGMMTAGLGILTIYHANLTLRSAERNRVALTPRISLGAQPTVGLRVSVAF